MKADFIYPSLMNEDFYAPKIGGKIVTREK